jgi:hypothetical protein
VKNEKHIDDTTILMATMEELVMEPLCTLDVFKRFAHCSRTFSKTSPCPPSRARGVNCTSDNLALKGGAQIIKTNENQAIRPGA